MALASALARSRRARVFFSLGLLVLGLLLVEGVLRLTWGSPRVESLDASIDELKRFNQGCFEVRVGEDGKAFLERQGIEGLQRVPRARTPGVRRIILVGESTGEYLGGHVRELLEKAPVPRRDVEFLNCGINGLNQSHLQRWLEEVYSLEPDVVVLVFGHNGFSVPERATSDLWLELWRRAMKSHLGRGLVAVPNIGQGTPEEYAAQSAVLKRRLAWMVEKSQAAGVRLIVSTLTSNLRFPPSSLPYPWLDSPERWRRTLVLDTGATMPPSLAWREGEETGTGLWPYLDGMTRLWAGDPDAARPLLEAALEHDPWGARAHRNVRAMLRGSGAWEVFELAAVVEAASDREIPAWDVFEDVVHPTPLVMHEAAWALLGQLDARPAGAEPPCVQENPGLEPWFTHHRTLRHQEGSFVQRAGLTDRVADAVAHGQADVDLVRAGALAAFTDGGLPGVGVLEDACLGLARAGHHDEARALLGLGERGDDAGFYFTAARIELMAGDPAAARPLLERAVKLDPEALGAAVYLAALSE